MHMLPKWIELISGYILLVILANSLRLNYFTKSKISENSTNTIIFIKGMTCNNCITSIEKTIGKIDGVKILNIELKTGKLEIDSSKNSIQKVKDAIIDLGFEASE